MFKKLLSHLKRSRARVNSEPAPLPCLPVPVYFVSAKEFYVPNHDWLIEDMQTYQEPEPLPRKDTRHITRQLSGIPTITMDTVKLEDV